MLLYGAIILVLLLFLCMIPERRVKVGIASMMRKPKNIEIWLDHHRSMGISRFYIRLEDTPELVDFLKNQPDVVLTEGTSDGSDEYHRSFTRQNNHVDNSLKISDMDWLIHIDSDELLRGDLNEISNLPTTVRTIYMKNKEAVYAKIPNDGDICFQAKRFRNCLEENSGCVSYVNGKGGGRVDNDVSCNGVHRFKSTFGEEQEREMSSLSVEHYESCDFGQYKSKFKHLAQNTQTDAPFPYYKESIEAARSNDDEKLRAVFEKYRVEK